MNNPVHSIGIDLGGTSLRLEAVDSAAKRIQSLEIPSPPRAEFPSLLRHLLKEHNWQPDYLSVGSRGVWKPEDRQAFAQSLAGLAQHVSVMSDVEAAWLAAFEPNEPGIIVISGTGSIAYGRDADGCSGRAGGLGPLVGDEGSGFWIAKTWLLEAEGRDLLHELQGHPAKIHAVIQQEASRVPEIIQRAQSGDSLSADVVDQARAHLIELVLAVKQKLHFDGQVAVSWGGSVLGDPWFREGFVAFLKAMKGAKRGDYVVREAQRTAAQALAGQFLNERR